MNCLHWQTQCLVKLSWGWWTYTWLTALSGLLSGNWPFSPIRLISAFQRSIASHAVELLRLTSGLLTALVIFREDTWKQRARYDYFLRVCLSKTRVSQSPVVEFGAISVCKLSRNRWGSQFFFGDMDYGHFLHVWLRDLSYYFFFWRQSFTMARTTSNLLETGQFWTRVPSTSTSGVLGSQTWHLILLMQFWS